MNIYLDMDDVVADWMGYARAYLKTSWAEGEMVPDHQWRTLKDDQRMYSKLPLKEGAVDLVNWVTEYTDKHPDVGLFFLTAVPHNNDMPWSLWTRCGGQDCTSLIYLCSSDRIAMTNMSDVKVPKTF